MRTIIAVLLLLACMGSRASSVEGRLELVWGDSADGSHGEFFVTLVGDDGGRTPLDPESALQAAGDIYRLAGERVLVETDTLSKRTTAVVHSLVPADKRAAAAIDGFPVLGSTVWATVMCRFADIDAEPKDRDYFQSQYDDNFGQLGHYWRAASYNKINLEGSQAFGWYSLPKPRVFYVPARRGLSLSKLAQDCISAADHEVDFSVVDGINLMFNAELKGFAYGGKYCAILDGRDHCWRITYNPPWAFVTMGILAHEMGHGYGLPHANNSDRDNDPYDNPWSNMSDVWGHAVLDPRPGSPYGTLGKHVGIFERDRLGWIDSERKLTLIAGTEVAGIQLDAVQLFDSTKPQVIVIRVPGEPKTSYYLIEARKRLGYDANLAGDAVLVQHVDTRRSEPLWVLDSDNPPADFADNEGSMLKSGEKFILRGVNPHRGQPELFRVRTGSKNENGFVVTICGGLRVGYRISQCYIAPAGPVTMPSHP